MSGIGISDQSGRHDDVRVYVLQSVDDDLLARLQTCRDNLQTILLCAQLHGVTDDFLLLVNDVDVLQVSDPFPQRPRSPAAPVGRANRQPNAHEHCRSEDALTDGQFGVREDSSHQEGGGGLIELVVREVHVPFVWKVFLACQRDGNRHARDSAVGA